MCSYLVVMAESVYREVTRNGYPGAGIFKSLRFNTKILAVKSVSDKDRVYETLFQNFTLGQGEKDTLVLFLKGNGRFVIIDDGKGARFCRKQQIPYINALLIPKILCFCNRLSPEEQQLKFKLLVKLGRYSNPVVHYAENCPRHELDRFMPGWNGKLNHRRKGRLYVSGNENSH